MMLVGPTTSSMWHYDLQEALSDGMISVDLMPYPPQGVDETSELVMMKTKHGQSFKCRLSLGSEDGGEPAPIDPTEALKGLKDACLATTAGWWSYEICFGKSVKQFHLLPDGTKKDETLLGEWNGSTPSVPTAQFTEMFDSGSICDLTGEPREASVVYSCQLGSAEIVHKVLEPATCVYRIHVVTGLLCQDKQGDATSLPCYPVDDEGNPLTKEQFVEDSGPASLSQNGAEAGGVGDAPSTSSSIAARFQEGDAWTGIYTCQGRQWFRFRILRVLASSPGEVVFSATLAFRHIQASGLYRAVGRYSVLDRKLKLTAGPWIVQPSEFIAIGFEGTIGFDGTTFHGVLPDCDHGPFSLSKEPQLFKPTAEAALDDIGSTAAEVVQRPGALDDDAWPPDKENDAAAAATNAEDQVVGGDGPSKQRQGGFQVMFAKSMDELDTMQAQLRAGGGRRCPERYPYAYRPEQGFDYCCGTADDNAGNLGINAGPMEDRSDSCKGHDFLECPMPPCADHASGHPEIGGGEGDVDVTRDGDVVGDDDPVMRQAKEQIKKLLGGDIDINNIQIVGSESDLAKFMAEGADLDKDEIDEYDESDPLLEDGGERDGGEVDGGGIDGDGGGAVAGQVKRGALASGADGTDPSKPAKRKNTLMVAKEVLNKGSKQDMAAVFGALKQYLAKQGKAKNDLQTKAEATHNKMEEMRHLYNKKRPRR